MEREIMDIGLPSLKEGHYQIISYESFNQYLIINSKHLTALNTSSSGTYTAISSAPPGTTSPYTLHFQICIAFSFTIILPF